MRQRPIHNKLYWVRVVIRKWLNISSEESDYSADTQDEVYSDTASDKENESGTWRSEGRFHVTKEEDARFDLIGSIPRVRRWNSETFRGQYLNTKEIRICVGTWNVGGNVPPDDIDIGDWIDTSEPADIYVLGFQEIVPLNPGNIFGAEDNSPVLKWENIIRDALNRIRPKRSRIKSYSYPQSPLKFKPSEGVRDIEEEIIPSERDNRAGEKIHLLNEESNNFDELKDGSFIDEVVLADTGRLFSLWMDERSRDAEDADIPAIQSSGCESIGLSWPKPPLGSLNQHDLERPASCKSIKYFKSCRSFQTYRVLKSTAKHVSSDLSLLVELDLESLMRLRKRPSYLRIVSKQMVGIFLTIWVRRSLRKHIQNLRVSTVGVGVMGYIGNKGSVSVSMSIYQTLFCFICTHLTSGEKDGDQLKRNADVHEILRRTRFHSFSAFGLPRSIHDHERIIWLGDLNYRINLSYEKTSELVARKEWHKLVEKDQLAREMRKGHAFEGWSEGTINFPPTYKYEINSEKYCGEDPKAGKRTPAWCDRIFSYGKGLRQLSYRRTELKLSDHRPVTATYMAEVEVFSPSEATTHVNFH